MDDSKADDGSPDPTGTLDDIADHVITAKALATNLGEDFLAHLLSMALYELATRGVAVDRPM